MGPRRPCIYKPADSGRKKRFCTSDMRRQGIDGGVVERHRRLQLQAERLAERIPQLHRACTDATQQSSESHDRSTASLSAPVLAGFLT